MIVFAKKKWKPEDISKQGSFRIDTIRFRRKNRSREESLGFLVEIKRIENDNFLFVWDCTRDLQNKNTVKE